MCIVPKILFAGFVALLAWGCVDNEYDITDISMKMEYDPNLAFPIGSTTIKLGDLLEKYALPENLKEGTDGSFTVEYEEELEPLRGEQVFLVPLQNQIVVPGVIFPATIPASGSVTREVTFIFPVRFLETQQVDSLITKCFYANIWGQSTFDPALSLQAKIAFLDMKKDTVIGGSKTSLTYTEEFSPTANYNYLTPNKYKAYNYKLRFSSTKDSVSETSVNVSLTLSGAAGTPINPASYFTAIMQLNELRYRVMYGYLGKKTILDMVYTFNVDFLNREMARNINWYNPQIGIKIRNSYAVPVQFSIDKIEMFSSVQNQLINVSPDATANNPRFINSPKAAFQEVSDNISFTKYNGYKSFYEGIENSAPKSIIYHVSAVANPDAVIDKHNIAMDTSAIFPKFYFKLPIWFRSGGFGYTDTLDFDLAGMQKDNQDVELKSLLIRLVSINNMPIDMNLQAYFLDEHNNILDSMFNTAGQSRQVLKAGTVDPATSLVTAPTKTVKDISFTPSQLSKMKNMKKLIYKVSVATALYDTQPNLYVKFQKQNSLKISFACQVQPKITRE